MLAVLVFHAWPGVLPGGFIGVDVFFVLSGFLITSGLVRTVDAGRGLQLRRFWLRRLRRLVPALVIVLVGATALSWVAVSATGELPAGLGWQWLGALTYTSNWVMLLQGGDYFTQAEPPLFQHLWSLAIEEQFYLLWPLLAGLILLLLWPRRDDAVGRRFRVPQRTGAVLVLAVASFAGMAWGQVQDASALRLYFGTDTHAFGLLFGAAVAVGTAHLPSERRGPAGAGRTTAAWVGLCVLGAAFVLVDGTSPSTYLGVLAAVTAVVALLVLHTVCGDQQDALSRVLSHGFLRWWGRRSYAAYLWHWPLLVLLRTVEGGRVPAWADALSAGGVLVLTALAASLSTHWVEEPILRQGLRHTLKGWWAALCGRGLGRGRLWRVPVVTATAGCLVLVPLAAVAHSPLQTALQRQIADGEEALRRAQQTPVQPSPQSTAAPAPSTSPESTPSPSSPAELPAGFTREELTDTLPASSHGPDVVLLGDSVALGAAPRLLAEMPGITVEASVGHQLWDAADELEARRRQGTLAPVVVVALGANGTTSAGDWKRILEIVGEDRQLVVVTPHGPQPWIADVNAQIERLAAEHPDRVAVADWNAASAYVTEFSPDGVHPRGEGPGIWARLVRLTIEQRLD